MQVNRKAMDPALAEIVRAFAESDFRHEILIATLLEILLEKKNADGTPFITREELDKKANEIKNKAVEQSKIAKPSNIIIPGQ